MIRGEKCLGLWGTAADNRECQRCGLTLTKNWPAGTTCPLNKKPKKKGRLGVRLFKKKENKEYIDKE